MNFTYQAGTNTATNGTALGADKQDIIVHQIVIGLPVNAGNIFLFNTRTAFSGQTDNLALKVTLPTYSTTNVNPGFYVMDFGREGLQLDGGNLMIDQTMQVSVIWEPKDEQA